MKVKVKILQGKECIVDILPTQTVLELKHKVSSLLGIDVPEQKLLLTGKTLADQNPLSFYPGIKDGSKLNLVVKQSGKSQEDKSSRMTMGVATLREEMARILSQYYTESETEAIVRETIKDLKHKVNNLSYDDLERLATALIQEQESTT